MNTTTIEKNTELIQIRVPAGLKDRTAKLFKSLGTSTSDVVRMMLIQADETQSVPFKIRTGAYPFTANEVIDEIKATFELEDMPLSEENIKDLQDIVLARTTTEAVRQKHLKRIKEKWGEKK